jgi:hypothetical protein
MKLSQLPLFVVAGIFLSGVAQANPPVTYYYNSSDSNLDDFQGMLTVESGEGGQNVPFLSFVMTADVDGENLTFTAADQTGSSEGIYANNPASNPLNIDPTPTYGIVDPVFGGLGLVLNGTSGSPYIEEVPSYPVDIIASDTGQWLLTPPSSSGSVPDNASTLLLLVSGVAGLVACRRGLAFAKR